MKAFDFDALDSVWNDSVWNVGFEPVRNAFGFDSTRNSRLPQNSPCKTSGCEASRVWQLKQHLYPQMVDLYRQMVDLNRQTVSVVQTMVRIDWMIAVVQTMVRIDWMTVLPPWKHAPIRTLYLCRLFLFPFDPSDPFPSSSFLLALL